VEKSLMILSVSLLLLVWQTGCFTIALEATDVVSAKAAEEESPQQEATEGPVEHALEEAGKATQKGVQTVKKAKREAIEAAKEVVE
jgi:hypothetical protein